MKFLEDESESLTLTTKEEIAESKKIEAGRKILQNIIQKKNEDLDYFTLGKNGLIPNGIRTKEKMQEYIQTANRQREIQEFAFKFNKLSKAKRKIYTYSDIFEVMNGITRSDLHNIGIHISTLSNLTLYSVFEILSQLEITVEDNKIIENEYIKLLYEPILDDKYKLVDAQINIYVTENGMYKLNYKW